MFERFIYSRARLVSLQLYKIVGGGLLRNERLRQHVVWVGERFQYHDHLVSLADDVDVIVFGFAHLLARRQREAWGSFKDETILSLDASRLVVVREVEHFTEDTANRPDVYLCTILCFGQNELGRAVPARHNVAGQFARPLQPSRLVLMQPIGNGLFLTTS